MCKIPVSPVCLCSILNLTSFWWYLSPASLWTNKKPQHTYILKTANEKNAFQQVENWGGHKIKMTCVHRNETLLTQTYLWFWNELFTYMLVWIFYMLLCMTFPPPVSYPPTFVHAFIHLNTHYSVWLFSKS